MQRPENILIRGVNWLGDAVMTTPALLRLRERFPDARITLLTPEKLRDLWRQHPALDESVSFAPSEGPLALGRRLRKKKFDLALVLPNSPRSALETWFAGIPRRVGYARPWRTWFLTDPVGTRPGHVPMRKRSANEIEKLIATPSVSTARPPATAHHIHEYLHLVAAMGGDPRPLPPRLEISRDEGKAVWEKFGLAGHIEGKSPVIGLNPGAEYGPAKRWPVERFIAAARVIQMQTGCVWLLLGGNADAALTAQIASAIHDARFSVHDLSGKTSLRELMALLKFCRLLLTNDTGPMHLAAALGTPVVVPFGSTSPELTGPGLPGDGHHSLLKSEAPCSPCFLRECPIDFRCMNGISVEQAVKAVGAVLNG